MRIKGIMEKLEMYSNFEGFQALAVSLKTILEYAGDLDTLSDWVSSILPVDKLDLNEIKLLLSEAERIKLSVKDFQEKVQRMIPRERRKRFAAYYTIRQVAELMVKLARDLHDSESLVIADPFLGSGITLTAAIDKIGPERILKVWGIELLPLPALIAYASLLQSMKGRREAIDVIVGDSFREVPSRDLPKADIILTNPPFTRWKYLERDYRESLVSLMRELGYGKYMRGESSLQVLSMFLCDRALRRGGLLVSVLPASTFYTIYGRGYKSFLREEYCLHAIVESRDRASLSEGSGFKEVIIIASKGSDKGLTALIRLNARDFDIEDYQRLNLDSLPKFLELNWLALFERELKDILVRIFELGLKKGTLGYWEEILGKNIIRGIEMYGPDFFFIPNKFWKITSEREDRIVIENGGMELVIGREFLVKTLRRPGLYFDRIEVDADSFMLSVPPKDISELPEDLRIYIEWGIESGAAKPAIKAYGSKWYSHVYGQIRAKEPFGHVFIPDKVDLLFRRRGVFANYSEEEVAASKNFYIVRDESLAKPLAGWLNSTFFISTLALLGRRISDTWTRFLENDYLELPVINPSEGAEEIAESISRMMDMRLPPLYDQLGEDYRYKLDLSVAKFIGIEDPEREIERMYSTLIDTIRGENS